MLTSPENIDLPYIHPAAEINIVYYLLYYQFYENNTINTRWRLD